MNVSHLTRVSAALTAAAIVATGCAGVQEPPPSSPRRPASAPPAGVVGRVHGEVWTTGLNEGGQLGRDARQHPMNVALAPAAGPAGRPRLTGVYAVASGARHSLAVLQGGLVVAWGANDKGQLGDGTTRARTVPQPVRAPGGRVGPLRGAVAVAADTDFSMALLRDGTVVTWGAGDAGQRGYGRRKPPLTPTKVLRPDGRGPLTDVTAIAADGSTEMALLRNGSVVAWGANNFGMIGDGTTRSRPLPRPVRGPDDAPALTGVTQIAIGGQHGLALLRDGTVAAWGRNQLGQLGDASTTDRVSPVRVAGMRGLPVLRDVVAISAGERHNYALRSDGTVVAWGDNAAGQLGDGSYTGSPRPVLVAGTHGTRLRGVARVFAGEAFGVAVLADGTPLTWGSGGKGQLGSGNRVPRNRPGPIVLAEGRKAGRVLDVGAGRRHLALLMRW
ncbi:hypothetical protein GCM10009678_76350 [Actinomadura kijaniata]|uniref:Alpha-tubulin suppressor-like RCC1 family protein n=1 Tax=Actinomadura namibiensis TaxID=182080 RepID=A0A7W3M0I9_ACTNM|nr:RCC1 domain-containing protein [Actinomadura namibiensis]MBA8957623.1 alpha-tubulin suppressor-like RCC1 family protein [Actinomadura namibiensis]